MKDEPAPPLPLRAPANDGTGQPSPSPEPTDDETAPSLPPPAAAAPPSPIAAHDFTRENTRRGYAYMLLSTVSFATLILLMHAAETRLDMPVSAALVVRAAGLVVLSPLVFLLTADVSAQTSRLRGLPRRAWGWIAARAVLGALGLSLHTMSLKYIPAGDATAIFLTIPVFTLLGAWRLLGETVPRATLGAAAVSLSGALLVGLPDGGSGSDALVVSATDRAVGSACSLGAAVLTAGAYTVVRKLGTSVHYLTTVFALGCVSLALGVCAGGAGALVETLTRRRDGWTAVGFVAAAAPCALGVQTGLAKALQLSKAGPAVMIRNLDVPVVYIASALLFGEIPSRGHAAGAALLVAATGVMALQKVR